MHGKLIEHLFWWEEKGKIRNRAARTSHRYWNRNLFSSSIIIFVSIVKEKEDPRDKRPDPATSRIAAGYGGTSRRWKKNIIVTKKNPHFDSKLKLKGRSARSHPIPASGSITLLSSTSSSVCAVLEPDRQRSKKNQTRSNKKKQVGRRSKQEEEARGNEETSTRSRQEARSKERITKNKMKPRNKEHKDQLSNCDFYM